jgi:glycosyltransferase involved in cell wall biosynthesis
LLDQYYPNWEALVVDDGSTDGSDEIVATFAEKDPRIQLIRRTHEPKGAPSCRNIGIRHSRSEYVIFLDSDDLLAPFCLGRRLEFFKKHPEQDFLVFPILIFKDIPEDGTHLWNHLQSDENDLDRFLGTFSPWQTSCPIWKLEAIRKYDLYWKEEYLSRQDLEYHIRALVLGMKYLKFDEVYDCYYRVGGSDQISGTDFFLKEKILSKNKVFTDIAELLEKQQLLNRHRAHLMGLYFLENLESNFAYRRNIHPGYFLRPCKKMKLCSTGFYFKIAFFYYFFFYLDYFFPMGRKISMFVYGKCKNSIFPASILRGRYSRWKKVDEGLSKRHRELISFYKYAAS